MLLDKPCANPLINTIAEYFLLKTVVSPMALPEMRLETALGLLHHKPITNHVKGSIPSTSMQNIPIPAQNQT